MYEINIASKISPAKQDYFAGDFCWFLRVLSVLRILKVMRVLELIRVLQDFRVMNDLRVFSFGFYLRYI